MNALVMADRAALWQMRSTSSQISVVAPASLLEPVHWPGVTTVPLSSQISLIANDHFTTEFIRKLNTYDFIFIRYPENF